jgi:integrase
VLGLDDGFNILQHKPEVLLGAPIPVASSRFQSVIRHFSELGILPKCRMRHFRHTFVSKLAEAQVADSTLMALTGHMSKRMIEHYSHHVRNQAKRDAVAVFDGLPSTVRAKTDSPQNPPK